MSSSILRSLSRTTALTTRNPASTDLKVDAGRYARVTVTPVLDREGNAVELIASVLQCAAAAGFATVDPFDEIDRAMRTAGRDFYYRQGEHFGPAGHRMIAGLVAERLR